MYEIVKSKSLYKGGSYSFTEDTIVLPDGNRSDVVQLHHPGGVAVFAVNDKKEVLIEKQYRFCVKQYLKEIPAGKLDKGEEDSVSGARRELAEETGYIAGDLVKLTTIYPSPGVLTESLDIYFTKVAGRGETDMDDDEFITVEWVPLNELGRMIEDGEIRDAKTIIGYYMGRSLA